MCFLHWVWNRIRESKRGKFCILSQNRFSLCALLGERLTEGEVDRLMAGLEDTNGCVNYEGKNRLKFFMMLFYYDSSFSLKFILIFSLHKIL